MHHYNGQNLESYLGMNHVEGKSLKPLYSIMKLNTINKSNKKEKKVFLVG
jgi:hypothetical protein